MARKKKDDFIENEDQPKVSLDDFVLPELITAFCNAYTPLDDWEEGCEIFTYTRLRNFFKAIVVNIGDPFAIYIRELGLSGFHFNVDIATGEPVMYVRA